MKSTIFFILMALSTAAHAEHWDCKGTHGLTNVSFDMDSSINNFKVVAPDLEQKGLDQAFMQVNSFTLVAYQLIDTKAQETMDYTLIVDRDAKTLKVFSQWSTNNNVDSESLNCSVK